MATRHPKPTPAQNAGRLVRRAAQVLEDRNWVQGTVGDTVRGMCVRGAIEFAAQGRMYTHRSGVAFQAEEHLSKWLLDVGAMTTLTSTGFQPPLIISVVPVWNDAPGRTKEEVIQYMRKFADEVDPQLK